MLEIWGITGKSPILPKKKPGTEKVAHPKLAIGRMGLKTPLTPRIVSLMCIWELFVGDIQRRGVTFAGTLLTWEEVFPTDFFTPELLSLERTFVSLPKYLPESNGKCKQFEINTFFAKCDGGGTFFVRDLTLESLNPSWYNRLANEQLVHFSCHCLEVW